MSCTVAVRVHTRECIVACIPASMPSFTMLTSSKAAVADEFMPGKVWEGRNVWSLSA